MSPTAEEMPALSTMFEGLTASELRNPIKTLKEKESLVPAYLRVKGLVKQHIDSFNYLIEEGIQSIVRANKRITSDVDPHFYIEFRDVRVGTPEVGDVVGGVLMHKPTTPHECRLRDLTYSAPITVTVQYLRGNQHIVRKDVPFGRMPIMLRSSNCVLTRCKTERHFADCNECPLDPGGYFVVKGSEKVILMHEQLSKNRMIVSNDKNNIMCHVMSVSEKKKVRSAVVLKNDVYCIKQHALTEEIPVSIVLKAMGLVCESEQMNYIGLGNTYTTEYAITLITAHKLGVQTQAHALQYIGERMSTKRFVRFARGGPEAPTTQSKSPIEEARIFLDGGFLVHVPVVKHNYKRKCIYVALMVRRIIDVQKDNSITDDLDYYGNKRVELAGSLLSLLFEDRFKELTGNVKSRIDVNLKKKASCGPVDAVAVIIGQQNVITAGIVNAISTGNWTIKRFKMDRAGATEVLSRQSYIAALGMMTRIKSQFEKSRKVSGPRSLQASQWGMICPSDTPEGEQCGLVKNLALMTHITTDVSADSLTHICFNLRVMDTDIMQNDDLSNPHLMMVFINGINIGMVSKHATFVNEFKQLRRNNYINSFVSIYTDIKHRAVHISSDGGRLCRPLLIVTNGVPRITERHLEKLRLGFLCFDDFVHDGIIEYLDVNEENDAHIAMYEKEIKPYTTHLEIEPYTILGVCAGLIPYPHHNQSPRNTYQCAMGKQAMGHIGFNQQKRIDTLQYDLVYSQKPLVKTRTIELIGFEQLSAGHNAVVAVMSYSGYDIEDAVVLNKASLDRGFGRCVVYRNVKTTLKSYINRSFDIVDGPIVDVTTAKNIWKHTALDSDGIAMVGEPVQPRQVLINKKMPAEDSATMNETPISQKLVGSVYVEQVIMSVDETDNPQLKLLLRQVRRPEIGDKFSSRHGQKGVTGLIVPQEDMPFTESGLQPDMVMNPHGFPSRMTLGKQIEFIASKAGAVGGELHYGTCFGGTKLKTVQNFLEKRGFHCEGKELLYNAQTGEPIPSYIYMGPVYYQKLKHMVMDKMHSRSLGPMASLTRQPTQGRSKDGGLRLGEMERDCLIAHGVSMLLMERLMISSDLFEADLCRQCGMIGYSSYCKYCQSSRHMSAIKIPYAAKLLFQELLGMNILPKIILSKHYE